MDLNKIKLDITAFADDESDFIVDQNGVVVFQKAGKIFNCKLRTNSTTGAIIVEFDGQEIPYPQFLSRHLAKLDLLAQKIIDKRDSGNIFVSAGASLETVSGERKMGAAIDLLREVCETELPFGSRVLFITADGGHGKTVLLRRFQKIQAERFLRGESTKLFWHVDLQGRQLVRLDEALMGDLGELRITGLFVPSIVRLLHNNLLVLAIDGFDELAAEQGSQDAISGLSVLLKRLEGSGTLIAASRRTFFETDDYLKRTQTLSAADSSNLSEFDRLALENWVKKDVISYFTMISYDGKKFENPEEVYDKLLEEFGGVANHPMLCRPFLVAQIAKGLLIYNLSPKDFVSGSGRDFDSVEKVIDAFIKREVSEKWKHRDTGEPYLSEQQHRDFLESVAEEMWIAQTDRLPIGILETLATLLFEKWNIPFDKRRQIIEMVRHHVLLTGVKDADTDLRSFDHIEFKNFFLACILKRSLQFEHPEDGANLKKILGLGQLPDSVARFAASLIQRTESVIRNILTQLVRLAEQEWRPSYLQVNIGTLVPMLAEGIDFSTRMELHGKLVFSSLVMEKLKLKNILFRECQFLRCSFLEAKWDTVRFDMCDFVEPAFSKKATFRNVLIGKESNIDCVRFLENDEEIIREYDPLGQRKVFRDIGIEFESKDGDSEKISKKLDSQPNSKSRECVRKLMLLVFSRTTTLSEDVIQKRFAADANFVVEKIMPLMQRYNIVQSIPWSGKGPQKLFWKISKRREDVLSAERKGGGDALTKFWTELDHLE